MQQHKTLYTLGFAAAVCIVCSLLVSAAAVGLRSRQKENELLEKRSNVLQAAGLLKPGETADAKKVEKLFAERVRPRLVELKTGEYYDGIDPENYDAQDVIDDPDMSYEAPDNKAKISKLPKYVKVYEIVKNDNVDLLVLPIRGMGLWSTLYGFLALDEDTRTIKGITYYQHGETPGLGGEVDSRKWKNLWIGRKAYDEDWKVAIEVIKGQAGAPEEDPYQVDGLSGATLTSRGVTNMLHFWLGENGLGPFLENFRRSRSA